MKALQFIRDVNYALKGTDDDAPTIGDDDWIYWIATANRKKNEMYDDSKRSWASAYAEGVDGEAVGTISADANLSFELDPAFISPAKQAYVVDSDGNYTYLDVIKPQSRNRQASAKQVFISGQNPQLLTFSVPILAGDSLIGGDLFLPGYYRPSDIRTDSDTAYIPVDDPNWLVMAVAAQVAFNDITYEDKFGDLNGQANVLYRQMSRRNSRGTHGQPSVTPTNVKRITGFR